jgi:hypothetical protein
MGGKMFLVGTYRGYHLKLNPSDARMRLIVCLGDDAKTISSTWNRPYTEKERTGLYLFALKVEQWLRTDLKIPEVQIIQAGNNSHSVVTSPDLKTKCFQLGTEKEPNMLHLHLICRSIPGEKISFPRLSSSFASSSFSSQSAIFRGPEPGEIFDLRGLGNESEGQKKLAWKDKDSERRAFLHFLRSKLGALKDEEEESRKKAETDFE